MLERPLYVNTPIQYSVLITAITGTFTAQKIRSRRQDMVGHANNRRQRCVDQVSIKSDVPGWSL